MISREEYKVFCDKLIPQEEIETYKRKTKKMWITLLIVVVCEILLTILLYPAWEYLPVLMGIVILVSIITIVLSMRYQWKDFKKRYSKDIFNCLLKDYKHEYNLDSFIDSHIFKDSGFGGDFDYYNGEDLLTVDIPNDDGTPSGVKLNICDLYVTKKETYTVTVKTSNGSKITREETRTIIIYKGVFGYVEFPFKFKCNLSLNVKYFNQKRIKLEDIKFNKTFKTYTNNQLEALVILTPTLITKLLHFSNRAPNLKLSITEKGIMYFGMARNLFTLNKMFKKPTGKVFEKFYDDIADILAMVNEIKDNNKVFKM